MLKGQFLIKALLDLGDPLTAVARHRARMRVVLSLNRAPAFTQPCLAALGPGHEPLWIQVQLDPA